MFYFETSSTTLFSYSLYRAASTQWTVQIPLAASLLYSQLILSLFCFCHFVFADMFSGYVIVMRITKIQLQRYMVSNEILSSKLWKTHIICRIVILIIFYT